MGRFARELPAHLEKYMTETVISLADSMLFRNELARLGDRYLAVTYMEVPTIFRTSIYAEMLVNEIVDRFCDQNIEKTELLEVVE